MGVSQNIRVFLNDVVSFQYPNSYESKGATCTAVYPQHVLILETLLKTEKERQIALLVDSIGAIQPHVIHTSQLLLAEFEATRHSTDNRILMVPLR